MTKPATLDLASTYVVVERDYSAIPIAVSPTVFEELDQRFDHCKGRLLVSSFIFDADWSTWERHTAGDEIVCLLSGAFVIVPKGVWHTARTTVPTKMLFVTPGEGTQNKPV